MDERHASVMLVTGASRGIGAATARAAAAAGFAVGVNFVADREAADAVVEQCRALGAPTVAIQADVRHEDEVERMFRAVVDELGPLTTLVNNAGVLQRQMRFEDMTLERWRRVLDVNVIGAFLCARAAVNAMSTRRGGRGGTIVNVSSAAARLGSPNEYVDYAASKAAVDTLTIGLAKEVASDGIRVNAVRPGLIHTEIHASGGDPGRVDRLAAQVPMGRGGSAEEVADVVLWLASEASSYVTGTLIDVTGGR